MQLFGYACDRNPVGYFVGDDCVRGTADIIAVSEMNNSPGEGGNVFGVIDYSAVSVVDE